MGNKKKEKNRHIKPSLENIKQMDELVLVDAETMLTNIDIPLFSDDVDSKFLATEEYLEKARSNDLNLTTKIDKMVIRIPELFNTICFQVDQGSYVVVKDKGSHLKMTCYNYLNIGKDMRLIENLMGMKGLDDEWIWSYESDGREIAFEGLHDKFGRFFTTIITNGKIELNYNFVSFAPILSGLKDKKQGRHDEFRRKTTAVTLAPSWRAMDIDALNDEDNEYSEYMMKRVLQADMTMAIMQYGYTCHIIANSKKFKESIVTTNKIETSRNNSNAVKTINKQSKNTYTINVDRFKNKARRVRAVRKRKEAILFKTDSWDVRGHKRTYKDGHSVWVKPSTHKRKEQLLQESQARVAKKYKINL